MVNMVQENSPRLVAAMFTKHLALGGDFLCAYAGPDSRDEGLAGRLRAVCGVFRAAVVHS